MPTVMLLQNFSVNKIYISRPLSSSVASMHDAKLNFLIHEIPYALNSHDFLIKVPLIGYQLILSSVKTTNTLSSIKTQIPI